jgi:hypothetical protein
MRTYEKLGLPLLTNEQYVEKIRKRAEELGTNGCSGPTLQVYVDTCYEHDVHYRTHETLFKRTINRRQADSVLRERTQARSPFGSVSPISWWRWIALRAFGRAAWNTPYRGTPLVEYPKIYRWPCP